MMKPSQIEPDRIQLLADLATQYQTELLALQGIRQSVAQQEAMDQLRAFSGQGSVITAVFRKGTAAGFLVSQADAATLKIQAIFVAPSFRRQGIATCLLTDAECRARNHGDLTCIIQVSPTNDDLLAFLRAQGLDVLDHLQLRRPHAGETLDHSVRLHSHRFRTARPLSRKRIHGVVPARAKGQKRRNKQRKEGTQADEFGSEEWGNEFGHDDDFYFIAGFTSGGAPYGVTWEQAWDEGLLSEDELLARGFPAGETVLAARDPEEELPF